MKKIFISTLIATLFSTSLIFVVLAQTNSPLLSRIAPIIIDIQQDVPITAEILVPVDGEYITATVPMTLGVALRVNLSSALTTTIDVITPTQDVNINVATPEPFVESNSELTAPKDDGFYTVGEEIAVGKWESENGQDSCVWKLLDENQETIDLHFGISGGVVTVTEDVFEVKFSGCGPFTYVGE